MSPDCLVSAPVMALSFGVSVKNRGCDRRRVGNPARKGSSKEAAEGAYCRIVGGVRSRSGTGFWLIVDLSVWTRRGWSGLRLRFGVVRCGR